MTSPAPDSRPLDAAPTDADLGRITFSKFCKHLSTVARHRALVLRHCFKAGLYRQGLTHDLSKYSPCEFWVGVRYYQGFRSPNAAERMALGFSSAWLHHKGRNRHHSEYWIDIAADGTTRLEGKPMPTRYVVEMFCDRIAASKVYKGAAYTDSCPLEYFYLERKGGPVPIHPDAEALLLQMLELLAEKGEDEALRTVRETIVKPRLTVGEHGTF